MYSNLETSWLFTLKSVRFVKYYVNVLLDLFKSLIIHSDCQGFMCKCTECVWIRHLPVVYTILRCTCMQPTHYEDNHKQLKIVMHYFIIFEMCRYTCI